MQSKIERKNPIKSIIYIIVMLLLCVISVIFAIIAVNEVKENRFESRLVNDIVDGKVTERQVNSWKIDSDDEFIRAIKHSESIKEKAYYHLVTNIELSIDKIESIKDVNFYGYLDGQGNEIKITQGNNKKILNKPIFNTIMQDASIKSLNILVEKSVTVGSDEYSEIAVLANSNEGLISTCSISADSLYIGKNCTSAAVLIVKNFNSISDIAVSANISYYTTDLPDWQCRFGGLSSASYGSVNNVLANIQFELSERSIFPLLSNERNQYVGYALGAFNEEEPEYANIYFLNGILNLNDPENSYAMLRLTDRNIESKENMPSDLRRVFSVPDDWGILSDGQVIPSVAKRK